jgi:hypothetical protein
MADLLYLIRLRLVPFRLKVQNLLHSRSGKDVVTASNSLAESEVFQHAAQSVTGNIGVGGPPQDLLENLLRRHQSPLSSRKVITTVRPLAQRKRTGCEVEARSQETDEQGLGVRCWGLGAEGNDEF